MTKLEWLMIVWDGVVLGCGSMMVHDKWKVWHSEREWLDRIGAMHDTPRKRFESNNLYRARITVSVMRGR